MSHEVKSRGNVCQHAQVGGTFLNGPKTTGCSYAGLWLDVRREQGQRAETLLQNQMRVQCEVAIVLREINLASWKLIYITTHEDIRHL